MNTFIIASLFSLSFTWLFSSSTFLTSMLLGKEQVRWAKTKKPMIGGLAIMCSLLGAFLISDWRVQEFPILGSSILFFCIGVIDDIIHLRPVQKLFLQICIGAISLFIIMHMQGSAVSILALGWVVLVINAFNFIDGLDGLATTFCIILMSWIIIIGTPSAFEYAIIGSCVGFLPYNKRNASFYLGDSGSSLLGCIIAMLTLPAILGGAHTTVSFLLVDYFVLSLPICDILYVTLSRKSRGISIVEGGTDHIPHRLARLIGENGATWGLIGYSISLLLVSFLARGLATSYQIVILLIVVCFNGIMIAKLDQKTKQYFRTHSIR